jgi:hypothetical protein
MLSLDDPQAFGLEMENIRSVLASRGASRAKIAVTKMDAAIWGGRLPFAFFNPVSSGKREEGRLPGSPIAAKSG